MDSPESLDLILQLQLFAEPDTEMPEKHLISVQCCAVEELEVEHSHALP